MELVQAMLVCSSCLGCPQTAFGVPIVQMRIAEGSQLRDQESAASQHPHTEFWPCLPSRTRGRRVLATQLPALQLL